VLGPFYQTNPEPGAPSVDVIAASQVPAVRCLHIEDMPQNPFPGKEVHARLYLHGDEWEMRLGLEGRSGAEQYFAACQEKYDRLKALGIRHVSGGNEPHPQSLVQYQALNQFYLRWVELVAGYGMVPWIYDWGVGWPEEGTAPWWVDSVRQARAAGGGMVVHLYGAPAVVGNEDYPDAWYSLRVRRTIDELYAVGLERGERWIIVGEGGIDGGVVQWGRHPHYMCAPMRGWVDWAQRYWVYQTPQGNRVLDERLYWEQLSAWDDALAAMPEIRYAFPFIAHPRPEWADFVLPQYVLDRMAAKHRVAVPEPATIPYYWSSRQGHVPSWVVLHDTEGSAAAAEAWFRSPENPSRSSAHVIVDAKGSVLRLIPDELAAHHAGNATLPGFTGNPNLVSLGIELEYPAAPASPPWPEVQLEAAADVVREWCKRWNIPRSRIVRHGTIDPTRRSDPRNWNEEAFLDRVFGSTRADIEAEIGDRAQAHVIPLNTQAALAKWGLAQGLLPASDEFRVSGRDGRVRVAQVFRDVSRRDVQIIAYCEYGKWDEIRWFERAN